MRLTHAAFRRFRNLTDVTLAPGPRATVLVGENGQGKTNTLEGLFLLGTLKPLRATRLSELVQFGLNSLGCEVEATFDTTAGPRTWGMSIVAGEKTLQSDGKTVRGVDEYLGDLRVVAFTPDDLQLVKGAPDERRRFLDRAVFGRFPAYLGESRDYIRALKNRNRILRDGGDAALRDAFDEQLARLGARLLRRRLDLLDELRPHAAAAFKAVGRLPVDLALEYRAAALDLRPDMDEPTLAQLLRDGLDARLGTDLDRRFTSVGPHADDLALDLGDRAARLYGSQGQQRAVVLALKIGEIESLRARIDRYPLLLLDDVSSELDPERNAHLMRYLRALDAQVLLTTTDLGLVRDGVGDDAVVYRVHDGTVGDRRPSLEPE